MAVIRKDDGGRQAAVERSGKQGKTAGDGGGWQGRHNFLRPGP